MSYIYLASPYSHPNPAVREARFLAVEAETARLLRDHVWVYSPIVHSHALSARHQLPGDFAFWREYNYAMMDQAAALWVLQIEGWRESVGVQAEIAYADTLGLEVRLFAPGGTA